MPWECTLSASDLDELRELLSQLFVEGSRLMRLKPHPDISAAVRGCPAVLNALFRSDRALSPSELARTCGLSDARIANMLRSLEERGLVERHPVAGDRRRVEVRITQAGRDEVSRRHDELERSAVDFLAELGIDTTRDLVRVLSEINGVLERRRTEGRDVVPPCEHDETLSNKEGEVCA